MIKKTFDLRKAMSGHPVISGIDIGYYKLSTNQCEMGDGFRHLFIMKDVEGEEFDGEHEYFIIANDHGEFMWIYGDDKGQLALVDEIDITEYWIATCRFKGNYECTPSPLFASNPQPSEDKAIQNLKDLYCGKYIDHSTIQTHKITRNE